MEEKILIKSEQYDAKKILAVIVLIGAVLSLLGFCYFVMDNMDDSWYDSKHNTYLLHQERGYCRSSDANQKCSDCKYIEGHPSKLLEAIDDTVTYYDVYWMPPVVIFALIGGLSYLWLRSYELTVTDKRIYGKVAWGKRVDLPVDSVSATAAVGLLKGVSVSTASGKISFLIMKNADEIYKVINDLLIERQQMKAKVVAPVEIPKNDEADQLKKYKDLLDSGVITQEEFDAKKKQLLGL